MWKHTVLFFLALLFAVLAFNSCGVKPFPCYTTSIPVDSIHVNDTVTFDATCTDSGKEFFWEINSRTDSSTYYGKTFTRSFDSTGTAEVYLYVINGSKSASRKDYLTILP